MGVSPISQPALHKFKAQVNNWNSKIILIIKYSRQADTSSCYFSHKCWNTHGQQKNWQNLASWLQESRWISACQKQKQKNTLKKSQKPNHKCVYLPLTDTNTLEFERMLTAVFSNRKKWTADSTKMLKSLLQTCGWCSPTVISTIPRTMMWLAWHAICR